MNDRKGKVSEDHRVGRAKTEGKIGIGWGQRVRQWAWWTQNTRQG